MANASVGDKEGGLDTAVESNPGRLRVTFITVMGILCAIAIFAGLYSWKALRASGQSGGAWPPAAVAALKVEASDVPMYIDAIGSLRAVQEVTVTPETSGRVVAIAFGAGEMVTAGRPLVQLFDAPERADRQAAEARVQLAKAQLTRSENLVKTNATSREVLDQRTAEYDQALAEVKQLDALIEQKQIRAPFDGQIGIRRIDLGEYLQPGDSVVSLTDTRSLYLDFSVPQQQLRWIDEGLPVDVTVDAWPDRQFTATVTTIEPRIDPDTRNIAVRATLPNPDKMLRPGMFVDARLHLPIQKRQLVLPATAIQTTAAGDSVVVIRGDDPSAGGQVEFVRVTISRRLGDYAVVSEGLTAGDVVVAEGQLKVSPGARVQVSKLLPGGESRQ